MTSFAVPAVVLAVAALATGAGLLWAPAVVAAALAVGYAALVTSVTRRAEHRDLMSAFGVPSGDTAPIDWGQVEGDLRLSEDGGPLVEVAARNDLTAGALVRFAASYLAAWALTPLVAGLRLAGGDLSDLERHDVIGRLVRFQQYGRSRSLQVLTVSVAATATVAVLGSSASAFAAPAASSSAAYTVRAGDTLGSIASAYGTTVAALAAANSLSNPNLIYVGQVLSLGGTASGGTASGGAAAGSGSYTVRAGDTLGSIASAYGTTVAALAAANSLSNPNLITVGQVLSLGSGATPATPTAAAPASSGTTYTVQSGDTLAGIAAKEGTTWPLLAAANNLTDPNVIYVGETLTLPGGTAPAPVAVPAPTAPTTTAITTPSSAAAEAVRVALAQIGKPYQYGGAGPASFDCSGLVMYAWAAAGVTLPHYSVAQYEDTSRISEAELQPGDIVFYDNGEGAQPGHETLYIGNGQVVAANSTGTFVQTQSITYDGTPSAFGRVS